MTLFYGDLWECIGNGNDIKNIMVIYGIINGDLDVYHTIWEWKTFSTDEKMLMTGIIG